MKDFAYYRPETLKDALELKKRFGSAARPLIGGTDLLVRIQKGQAEMDAVIDLKRVADISNSIEVADGHISIGARVVLSDLVQNRDIQKHYPALIDAASVVGSIQIRNRATLVGNICNASPAADTVPVLMAYGALVTLSGRQGKKSVLLEDFFLGPGKTRCGASDLVISVEIPIPEQPFGDAFGRLTRRRGVDLATINIACSINKEGLTTFVFGAAGPKPIIARDKSGKLSGPNLAEDERDGALKKLLENTTPISDVRAAKEYREAMLLTIGRRVLSRALERYNRYERK